VLTYYLTKWLNKVLNNYSQHLDRVFQALSDSTRRGILQQIREQDLAVNDIAAQFSISLPAVSKHLGVLERAGLVRRIKHGRQRICHAEPRMLDDALAWLEFYQQFWDHRLDTLKQVVEQQHLAKDKP